MIIDFFSLTGAWIDSCDAAQVAMLLPILRTLYGDVTMVERGAAVDVVADDFGTCKMSL